MSNSKNITNIIIATLLFVFGLSAMFTTVLKFSDGEDAMLTPQIVKDLAENPLPPLPEIKHISELNATQLQMPENITETAALTSLLESKKIVDELKRQNFSNLFVRDLYLESKTAFDGENVTRILREINQTKNETQRKLAYALYFGAKKVLNGSEKIGENYSKVFENWILIEKRQREVYRFADAIHLLEDTVNSLNRTTINFSDVDEEFNLVRTKFDNEQFSDLSALISDTYKKIDQTIIESSRIRTIYKASRNALVYFVRVRYKELIISMIIMSIAGLILYNELKIKNLRKKIDDAASERKIITSLLKRAQENYFIDSKISKRIYDAKIKHFREKTVKLNAEIPVFAKKLLEKEGYRKYYIFSKEQKDNADKHNSKTLNVKIKKKFIK